MERGLLTLLILAAVLPSALSCAGAADKKSLSTLKRFLGIDYVDRLLYGRNTSYSETEYIKRASDLNCDFERPEVCRWSNYRSKGTDPRDQVDWFLFKQTDRKKWPAGFQPGQQPPLGSQFILAGDKSTELSSSIFYSNPIRCQRSGQLSFNYLLYSNAKLEVLLLKPGTDPVEILNVMPAHDCSKFARPPRGEKTVRCIVTTPAVQEPFQLAIRAHSLRNSLSVVDDIVYSGDICSDDSSSPTSGSKNFESLLGRWEPHESGLEGRLIGTANEVDCSDFRGCRWGVAEGSSNARWRVQTARPTDAARWLAETKTSTMPTVPYLALVSDGGDRDVTRAAFVSDPFACQRGDGTISLRYWLTPGAEVEVCAVAAESLSKFHCERLGQSGSPGPRRIRIVGPINEEFFISVEGIVPPEGGFVALDDFDYTADVCPASLAPPTAAPARPSDLLASLKRTPLTGGLTGGTVEYPEDLECNFSPEPSGPRSEEYLCQWGNGATGRGGESWQIVDGPVNPNILEQTTGTPIGPDGEFAAVEFRSTGGVGSLVSDPMECQTERGAVKLSYWLSEGVELRVCAVDAATGRRLHSDCPLVDRGPTSAVEDLIPLPNQPNPIINRPFKIEIEATSPKEGFALVDDVEYVGGLCRIRPPVAATPDPGRETLVEACRVVRCSVDGNSLCNFDSFPMRAGDPQFRVYDRAIGGAQNIMVGQFYPEPFMGTLIERRRTLTGQRSSAGEVAVLRSRGFRIAPGQQATLRFKHQRSTVGSELWFCRNMFNRDVETVPLRDQRSCTRVSGGDDVSEIKGITRAQIPITSRDNRIILVAYHPETERRGSGSFLIDDITLTTPEGDDLC